MRHSLLLSPVLLAACTEYNLNKDGNFPNPGDTGTYTDECITTDYEQTQVPLLESCSADPETGTFTPVLKWNKGTWSVSPESNNIMMAPIVVSLNDDNGDGQITPMDTPDIVVITYTGGGSPPYVVRAVSGSDGAELWNVVGNWQLTGALAGGDVDGDGIVEIAVPTGTSITLLENDGTTKWVSQSLSGHVVGTSDAPSIADMNGDGDPEIIMGKAILSSQGNLIGAGNRGMGYNTSNVGATSVVADLDLDGQQEVVVGNAVYQMNGAAICTNSNMDGYPAVGNFDNDPEGEFVVVSSGGQVRLHDTNCQPIWTAQIPGATQAYFGGPPTIADYDGDNEAEVGVAANNSYTVFDTNGSLLWQMATQDASSGNTGSSVFDFEGDGFAEAVYADETRLWVFNGTNGEVKLESTDHASGTWTEYPVIADIDGDNHAEIVVTNNDTITGIPINGISVIEDADDSWRPARRIWNQHAYSITNVNDNGTIPANPAPNWSSYNNFRSGDMSAALPGADYPDLTATIDEVCSRLCDEGSLTVSVRVSNQGFASVPKDFQLALIAETDAGDVVLETRTITGGVGSGIMRESLVFDLTEIDTEAINDLRLEVDGGDNAPDGGTYMECNEENNSDNWGLAPCLE